MSDYDEEDDRFNKRAELVAGGLVIALGRNWPQWMLLIETIKQPMLSFKESRWKSQLWFQIHIAQTISNEDATMTMLNDDEILRLAQALLWLLPEYDGAILPERLVPLAQVLSIDKAAIVIGHIIRTKPEKITIFVEHLAQLQMAQAPILDVNVGEKEMIYVP